MYLDKNIDEITELCRQNSVRTLYAFGSVLTDRFKADSDIDLVVDISSEDPREYANQYFNLKFTLEDLLKRKIDLLESSEIKNKYFPEELAETQSLIYGS
jgi:predicted nucleotidyltransferase